MHIQNDHDKYKVIVLKVTDTDLEGLLINHDLNDNGQYSYMECEFVDAVMRYLPEYAMGDEPAPTSVVDIVPYLKETASSVIKVKKISEIKKYIEAETPYDQWDPEILKIYSSKGIFSELILHFLLRSIHNTTPLISKIYFKDSFAHEAHGFDSVHVSNDNKLWLGETKFYNDSKRGIKALIEDLNAHFKHDYLKEQFLIINRALTHKNPEREAWIEKLQNATRLEEKLEMIVVPLLCIYEDSFATTVIDAVNNGTNTDTLVLEHISALQEYFKKNNTFVNKDRLQTLLILLPVECKKRIVAEMLGRICNMQGILGGHYGE